MKAFVCQFGQEDCERVYRGTRVKFELLASIKPGGFSCRLTRQASACSERLRLSLARLVP
jgi:hypothetical protein